MKIANVVLGNVGCRPNWSRLCDWLSRRRPDIVTLQKTGSSAPFPTDLLRKFGYESWSLHHSRNYLGVTILGREGFLNCIDVPLPTVRHRELPCDDRNESRFLTLSIGDLWVSSIYAPYGPESLGERGVIERRVAWLNGLRDHVRSEGHGRWVLCGDFNVKADGPPWGKCYSQHERDALEELKDLGFCDLYRAKYGNSTEKCGYTLGYGPKCPNGTSRLHLILASKSLAERLQSACVEVESKPWPRKDAPPLVVELGDT